MIEVIYQIQISEGRTVTGEEIMNALQKIVQGADFRYCSFRKRLLKSTDSGDLFLLGVSSEYPGSDVAVVTLPSKLPEISLEQKYQNGDLAVRSWEFPGLVFAVNTSPEDTKEAVKKIQLALENYFNS